MKRPRRRRVLPAPAWLRRLAVAAFAPVERAGPAQDGCLDRLDPRRGDLFARESGSPLDDVLPIDLPPRPGAGRDGRRRR